MKKGVLKIVLVIFVLILIIAQFIRPDLNQGDMDVNKDFLVTEAASPAVAILMKNACYDCHSNSTSYPWYSKISPLSFWIQGHVDHGKENLNFSEWTTYSIKKKKHKLEECVEEVEDGKMPLKSYTWMHGNAKLNQEDMDLLVEWFRALIAQY